MPFNLTEPPNPNWQETGSNILLWFLFWSGKLINIFVNFLVNSGIPLKSDGIKVVVALISCIIIYFSLGITKKVLKYIIILLFIWLIIGLIFG